MPEPQNANSSPPERPVDQKRIRLMHCIGSLQIGGAEKQLLELIRRLPRDRFDQSLVLLQGGGPLLGDVRSTGCEVIELGWEMRYPWFDPRCYIAIGSVLRRYVRFIRKRQPNILHAQLYWANIMTVAAGLLSRGPVVITSRLHLSDYKKGSRLRQALENLANRFTDAVFANSEAVRADILTHEKIDASMIRVIRNGVLLENFRAAVKEPLRAEFGIANFDTVLLVVANLHPDKGHIELIEALGRISARFPNLKVIFAGRDEGNRTRLIHRAKALGVDDLVKIAGERTDIPDLLALADIVVHPSYHEGFSNAILEAMATARPVIATDVGGNPEAVIDEETGLLIPIRDPDSLAKAIERLSSDSHLRQSMGDAGRRRIQNYFSMEHMIESFSAWYASLLEVPRK